MELRDIFLLSEFGIKKYGNVATLHFLVGCCEGKLSVSAAVTF